MILFERDWTELHPEAIVDYETSNTKFVRQAALYREMGIKNHNFVLALHNKTLQGVNPRDPNLTEGQKLAILQECRENFWYVLREIAIDPKGSDDNPIRFEPNRGVIAASWLFFNHITFFLIMIRQTGKSFWMYWLYTALLNWMCTKTELSHLTRNDQLRMRDNESLKSLEASLPEYLRMRAKTDPASTEVFRISSMGNTFKGYVPNKSPAAADQIGRGMTSPIVGVDEFAYIFNNFISINVMLSTTLRAGEIAEHKGEPHGIMFATTTGKRDTAEGRYAYDLVMSSAVMNEAFFDAEGPEELKRIVISASGKDCRVNCTYNHRQLGKDDAWLADRITRAMQDDDTQIEADYLNQWPSGSLTSPFSKDVAEEIRASEVADHHLEINGTEGYLLRWYYAADTYQRFMQQDDHVMGIDPSDAIGRDAIGVVQLRARTGETSMATTIPKTNLIAYAIWLCDYIAYNKRVTVIIERRGSGATILDYLLLYLPSKGVNPFERIYNKVVQEHLEYKDRYEDIQRSSNRLEELCIKYKDTFGFATSGSGMTSRRDLYGRTLTSATRMLATMVRDRTLILQMLGLVVKNNRIDHADGEHDDMVISWLLCYWLLAYGKNLQYYGIQTREILRDNPKAIEQKSAKSAYENYIAEKLRKEIDQVTSRLETENDENAVNRLEYDLRRLTSLMPEEERAIYSVDAFIAKVKDRIQQSRASTQNYYDYTPTPYTGGFGYGEEYSM